MFFNIRNISWKFEEDCLDEGDRFLVNFKTSEKIDPKKFTYTFVLEKFYKNEISQKLNDIFEFYKNWLVVCI